ncbi:hypothetical protein ACE1B6_14085 [Aerosakkonemataceae cyanobacterium BLCC-F154]|uniref:Uncharacterized protein n=1 Tax=Floridaenema fluviatile BLCC-F154 TaxID=3153640 RepID=A0ABV4YEU6_9CYAN
MNQEKNQSSSQSPTDTNPEMDRTPQYYQPESGYRTDAEEEELRPSSPLNPRVADKSQQATEEA